ncbi:MAG: efflux RND transporter periplasmic adaptor subunit [Planctomycetes bacterium]|nr:efflux RND transporter periplasmic adaptor subunit [Planctomycetota bacterium]
MKIWFFFIVLLAGAAGGGYWYFYIRTSQPASPLANVRFAEVGRGPISVIVNATGQLQPVTQVDVSTQVSGTLDKINIDFNSQVKEGDILAVLNTDNLLAHVAQNRANLKRSQASVERLKVEYANAGRQAKRLTDLYEKQVISKVDYENAEMNRDSLAVQVKVSEAEVEQAQTTLRQSEIDLEHATIHSPISGVVINRAVEVGQTVAASFNSPLLFQIAKDLTQMQIRASIDEADIGRIQRSKRAGFTVDAFGGRLFDAKLDQVRLNPTVTSNVVIYTCMFLVDNREPDGSLGPLVPGLTANLSVLIDARDDAILVPSAAIRFQPKGIVASALANGGVVPAANMPSSAPDHGLNGDALVSATMSKMKSAATGPAVLWIKDGEMLRPITIQTGLNDGNNYEVLGGLLKPGDLVAVGLATSDAASNGSFSPFGGGMNAQRPGGGMGSGGNRTTAGAARGGR